MATYRTLPEALQPYFDADTLPIPDTVLVVIADGWAAMRKDERRELVGRLHNESDSLSRVLVACDRAVRAQLI